MSDIPRKSPLTKTKTPLLPPRARSRKAHLLIPPAGAGRFELPCCAGCGTFAWPFPEACAQCLSDKITLKPAPRGARVIAATTAEVPADSYFRALAPWRVGLVQMDCGPQALVHLAPDCPPETRLTLSLILDRAGQAVLHASRKGQDMSQDPQWAEMTCAPKDRRVLITDARHIAAPALVKALLQAGARKIMLGLSEPWKPFDPTPFQGAEMVALDLRSDRSVADFARDHGGKVDILINTAEYLRSGNAPTDAREAMEVQYFGLSRLIRTLAPIMAGRGGDGPYRAVAWVNLASVFGQVPHPRYQAIAPAHAAALALAPQLRQTLAGGGVRLLTVTTGPTEAPWFDAEPFPKLGASAIAKGIVTALTQGLEEVVLGDIAKDWLTRHQENPRALEAELARGQS